jgi:DNA-binding CsgD family transcriptional regulator
VTRTNDQLLKFRERELREGLGGRPLHLPDGVVVSVDSRGREWRTAVEVELTRKTEARLAAILRHLLGGYDDVVDRVEPSAMTVVTRAVAGLDHGGAGAGAGLSAADAGGRRLRLRPSGGGQAAYLPQIPRLPPMTGGGRGPLRGLPPAPPPRTRPRGPSKRSPTSPERSGVAELAKGTPAIMRRMKTPPNRPRLVGRGRELDLLRDELGRATAGEFRCVVLVGEAGVGKTRLAAEIMARYGAASIGLSARGHALGETASFGVWAEAFESHLRGLTPAEVAAACGGFLDDLAGLLHSVAALGGTAREREPPRARLREGLAMLLANLAARRRVIAVLDDLHWADPSSFAALRYLAHNLSSSRVLVVATARPYELAADAFGTEVLLGLEQEGFARRLEIGPMAAEGIGELAASVLDRPAPGTLVDWLAQRSGGNPLFAHGLLRALVEEGADLGAPGLRRLPEDLAGRVNAWLGGLDEPSRATLELLAVVGRRLELGELVGLANRPVEHLGEILDGLHRRGLVTEDTQASSISYEITHPVMTEIIYGQLGGVRRRALHRLVARSLLGAGRPGEAAPHFARSAEVGEPEAVEALRAAIGQAERRQAYQELFAVLKALVELLPAGDERWLGVFEVMDPDAIWVIEQRTDRPDIDAVVGVKAMRAIDAVLSRSADPVRRGTAKLRLANFAGWGTDEIEEAESACRQAVELFRDAGDRGRTLIATCQLGWLRGIAGDLSGWEATSRRVMDDAVAAGLDDVLLHGLTSLGMSLCFSGCFAEGEAVLRRAVTVSAADAKHAHRAAWSQGVLAAALAEQGRLSEAEDELAAARRAVPLSPGITLNQFAVVFAWIAGDYRQAVERARLAVTSHPGVLGRRHALGPGFAALAAAEMGLLGEADAYASQAVAACGKRGWLFGHVARWARAVVDWRTGRKEEALASLRHLGAELVAGRHRWVARWALPDLIELATDLGQAETAAAASRDLAAIVAGTDCASSEGFAALGRAWSGLAAQQPDPDAAREAAEWFSTTGFRGLHGRALLVLGRSLPGRQGRRPLEEAASIFAAAGALWRRDQALADLRALGSAGRKAATRASGPGRLSHREYEVALLAAQGLSAGDIAARLFIGRRTVDYHLANIYAKLGLASKLDLAARADEFGLRPR